MYAVIKSGGKQYKVARDQTLKLEKLEAEVGKKIDFDQVLMVMDGEDISIGTPFVANATVSAEILHHGRHQKISIIKFKRRKHHLKRQGHRQDYTEVKITDIAVPKAKQPAEKSVTEEQNNGS